MWTFDTTGVDAAAALGDAEPASPFDVVLRDPGAGAFDVSLSDPVAFPDLSWQPGFPDRTTRKVSTVARQRAYFGPDTVPTPTLPDLSWQPSFAASVVRRKPVVALLLAAMVAPMPMAATPRVAWTAQYPDTVRRLKFNAAEQQAFAAPDTLPTHQPLGWNVSFPDRVERKRGLPTADQRAFAAPDQAPTPTVPDRGWTSFPDRVERKRGLPTTLQKAYFGELIPWDIDHVSNKGAPRAGDQWARFIAVAGLASGPSNTWLMQEPSGTIPDTIGSATLSASSLYGLATAGWERLATGHIDTGGSAFFNGTVGDTSTTSQLLLAYVAVTATPIATRDIIGLGAGAGYRGAQVTATPVLHGQEFGGGGMDGIVTVDTTVHPVIIQFNRAAGTFTVYSDKEILTGPYNAPVATGANVFFGAAIGQAATERYLYGALFSGAAAEISQAQVRTMLETLGWTVDWPAALVAQPQFPSVLPKRRSTPVAHQRSYFAPDTLVVAVQADVSWLARFPDSTRQIKFHVSQQKHFVAPEVQPTYEPLGWDPTYPDFTRPKTSLPVVSQKAFVAPERQPDPPEHSWSSVYPDRVTRLTFPTASQRAYSAPDYLEVVVQNDVSWMSRYPDSTRQIKFHVSQQKHFTAPGQLPTYEPLAWNVTYPDRIPPKRGLLVTHQRAVFAPEIQPIYQPLAWNVTYPDRIPPKRGLPTTQQRAAFAPEQLPTYQDLGWALTFPDRIDPKHGLATSQQRAAFAPEQLPTHQPLGWTQTSFPDRLTRPTFPVTEQRAFFTADQLPTYEPLGWYGVYPDRVVTRTFPTTQQRAFTAPDQLPAPNAVADVSWLATFPPYLRRQAMLATPSQRAFFAPEIQPTYQPLGWTETSFPDRLTKPTYPVVEQRAFFSADQLPTYQPLGWNLTYPDRINPKRGLPATLQKHFTSPEQLPTYQPLAWNVTYPDRLYRFTLLTAEQKHTVAPDRQPDPPVRSWSSSYPDHLTRPTFPTSEQRAFTAPARQPEPPALAWLAAYPDRLYRPTFATAEQLAWTAPERQPDPPTHSWSAVYVDRVTRFTFPIDLQQAFVGSLAPVVPLPPLPPLTWQPVYPVTISRWAPRTHFSPTFSAPPLVIPNPNLTAGRLRAILTADGSTGIICINTLSAELISTIPSGKLDGEDD